MSYVFDPAEPLLQEFESFDEAEKQADQRDAFLINHRDDLVYLSGPQLVQLHNLVAKDAGKPETKRFSDKPKGVDRTWSLIKAARLKPAPKVPAKRRGRGINLRPIEPIRSCRAGSKQSIMVDMLSREQGASLSELREALKGGKKPWLDVTIKSGLNWDMNKVKGYGIRTEHVDGEDRYFLVLPEGMSAPVKHRQSGN